MVIYVKNKTVYVTPALPESNLLSITGGKSMSKAFSLYCNGMRINFIRIICYFGGIFRAGNTHLYLCIAVTLYGIYFCSI